jgi:hypothetical protein
LALSLADGGDDEFATGIFGFDCSRDVAERLSVASDYQMMIASGDGKP